MPGRVGEETGADRIGGELPEFCAGEALGCVGEKVFVCNVRAEEGGVVGVEGDEKAGIEVASQRVRGERCAHAGADVGSGIELQGNFSRF